MKIQNINNNNYINYKSNLSEIKKEEIKKENKYDVVDFKGRNKEDISLQSIKKKVVSQINEETKADKINRIKDSINNKTYSIDVEEIVKKLLK